MNKISCMLRKIVYKYKKMMVKIERPNMEKLSDSQIKTIKIVTKILMDSETELHTNPLEGKIYMKKFTDNELNIFITIEHLEKGFRVTMIGKHFNYNLEKTIEKFNHEINLPPITGKKIMNKFYRVLKRTINNMENEIIKESDNNLSDLIYILNCD